MPENTKCPNSKCPSSMCPKSSNSKCPKFQVSIPKGVHSKCDKNEDFDFVCGCPLSNNRVIYSWYLLIIMFALPICIICICYTIIIFRVKEAKKGFEVTGSRHYGSKSTENSSSTSRHHSQLGTGSIGGLVRKTPKPQSPDSCVLILPFSLI